MMCADCLARVARFEPEGVIFIDGFRAGVFRFLSWVLILGVQRVEVVPDRSSWWWFDGLRSGIVVRQADCCCLEQEHSPKILAT